MPASGKKGTMSQAELGQRSEAGQLHGTHGAYAFRDRGPGALAVSNRSRLAELQELVSNRPGLLSLMEEGVTKSVMMVEILTAYIGEQKDAGVPLDQIPALKVLPAFMNTAQRAMKDLIALLPDNRDVIDEEAILHSLKGMSNDQAEPEDKEG